LIEYNRFEDNRADAMQVETRDGVNFANVTIRYNYGHNRIGSGGFSWNAGIHTDFIQIHRGPSRNINIYGNLIVAFTNPLLLGDSWGSPTNANIRDNFITFESNAISTNSRGNVEGTYNISNNTVALYDRESGSAAGILLNNPDSDGTANVNCNVFFGATDNLTIDIDGSVDVNGGDNVRTGRVSDSHKEITSEFSDLGWTMSDSADLSGISRLTSPQNGASCTQGASCASVSEHLRMISQSSRAFGEFHFAQEPETQVYMPLFGLNSETLEMQYTDGDFPLRINAGADENIEDEADYSSYWLSDRHNLGGDTAYRDNLEIDFYSQTERWGSRGYQIPVANGTYRVVLHFAETYGEITGAGQRVFDLDVEGSVLKELDIYAEVGPSTGLTKTFVVQVNDNVLDIELIQKIEETSISGIEVYQEEAQ
ncbi:MAG: malectin domain-containing carbohydrate-binding protein, partial [Chloroflexota bacterium]